MARLLLLALLLQAAPSSARDRLTLAVMPFRDLAGSNKPVGEAIRESVTSDLRGGQGIRVVERAEMDKVLAELDLQAAAEPDAADARRLGKVLGADLIALGAYQQVGRRVRLTARLVKVETGEVLGTAKVDGDVSAFLRLQDRLTVELLKSTRLFPAVARRLGRRSRPKLRSLRPVALYGKAATERDDAIRAALLKEAVKEAPDYSDATDALARLERKLKAAEVEAEAAQKATLDRARATFEAAKTPHERFGYGAALGAQLALARRYHEQLALWRILAKEAKDETQRAQARAWEIDTLYLLSRLDEVLERGEAFLADHAGSPALPQVKARLQEVIDLRREQAAGKAKAAQEVEEVTGEGRWDLCRLARIYQAHRQYPEAERLHLACLAAGVGDPKLALLQLALGAIATGDFASAKKWMQTLEATSPSYYQAHRSLELRIPTDE